MGRYALEEEPIRFDAYTSDCSLVFDNMIRMVLLQRTPNLIVSKCG
jgi:hypothetical protein